MIKISKKIIWAVIFIILVIVGTFILIWLFKPGSEDQSCQVEYSEEETVVEENTLSLEEEQKEIHRGIPKGMKEINLPVSFYGDHKALKKGNRVDIISTYYKEEAGSLYSERIIADREIIRLESERSQEIEDNLSLGDAFIYDGISGTGAAIDMSNILVMTFFLTDDEVLKSFTALESGMLYIALCPENDQIEWGNN